MLRRRRIGPDHRRAEARERLAQEAAAAADIEDSQAAEAGWARGVAAEPPAGRVADIGEANRIEIVQDRHFAVRVPPLAGQPGKAVRPR